MGISGSYGSDLPEVTSILPGAQLIGTKDDILFRADPGLLGGTTVIDGLSSTSTTAALSANQGNALDGRLQTVESDKADIDSPALITPTATSHPDTNDSSLRLATTQMVQGAAAANQRYQFLNDSTTTLTTY